MTKKKRMILFAVCAVILLGVLAAVLFRFVIPKETGVCGDTATYKIVGDTLYIEGSGRCIITGIPIAVYIGSWRMRRGGKTETVSAKS